MSENKKRKSEDVVPFTKWTPELFLEKFAFEYRPILMNLFEPESLNISQKVVDFISEGVASVIQAQSEIDLMNETSREDIIQTILSGLIAHLNKQFGHKILTLKREESFLGNFSVGRVEFMIKSHQIILMIVEAKRQDMSFGLLQNIMEIHQAGQLNGPDKIVYGVISTAEEWVFTKYINKTPQNMANWWKSPIYNLAPYTQKQEDPEAWRPCIDKITGMLNWILQEAIKELS